MTMHRTMMMAAVVAAGLAAPASAEDSVTYSGWLGTYDKNADLVQRLQDEFKARTGAELKVVDTQYSEALNQATVTTLAGNPADALHLVAGWVPAMQEIGGLEPLNDYFTEEQLATIPEALRDAVSVDGKLYALPWVPGPIQPHFNRNLMIEAGLDPENPPQTWPEFKDAIMKICALPDKNGAKIYGIALRTNQSPNSAQWAIPVIYGFGGDIHKDGEIDINTPEAKAAFEWIQDITEAGCSPKGHGYSESRNTFGTGHAGFILEGPWGRGLIKNISGGALEVAPDGDVWVMEMPKAPDGTRKTIGNPHEIAMSSQAKDKELTAKLLQLLIFNDEITTMYYDINGQLPTGSVPLLKQGAVGADPYSQLFVNALSYTHDNPWKNAKFNAVMSQIAPQLQNVVDGGDVSEALAAADKSIDRLLSRD
ncbi:ABC transporter substrate-binding protein [Microbaculum marinisediminis]|uniref:Sugar ABC transporter substrate-binding protein n=1 Tax=Microbaculum marinisediminis TaxID=2931392 RepID=A0AAW5QYF4_9HYPH|nr:sugar ABC transporter substrate-binding protein [Microbaculum sp. A6E488]MCT8971389.1 sugar ABC transporter substrate-binding protein [Microbaculum sp. A6E488]